jgi:predicted nucleotidyltransferase
VLFGSRARGTNNATADIDLAVYAPRITHRQLSLLSDDLDETNIIYRFDLVHINETANPQLIANIEKEGQVIYGE